ncbi:EAL domain-containing protein [Xylophilus sp. GOD-11R]|uniref:EAL domain-containing protein n=1 Tax=Xylophilus sp. GOD-11R TaxID=3089814 RepID=UPI00298C4A61|nr:EAL domain-containing protein [Xylophilus sp. GOD-11R]WPB58194.1 EAL domain-containing protein [Xylophilus sp. GOD-11R]
MLIYLLDLSAVIFVSGILINEKYLSIDFTRKEEVGSIYSAAVRELLLMPFLPYKEQVEPPEKALQRFAELRARYDGVLHSAEASALFERSWRQAAAARQAGNSGPQDDLLNRGMLRSARELLTTVGNQSNLILDPDLDSYYAMSLVVLRFPELLEVIDDTMRAIDGGGNRAQAFGERRSELLILAGRIDASTMGIRSDYLQVFAAGSPALRAALDPGRQSLADALADFLTIVQRLAGPEAGPRDVAQLQAARSALLYELDRAWIRGASELDELLAARVQSLFTRMFLHLGTALLLLGCILTLVYAVAQQIARPLRHLAGVADNVRRSGDYALRAHWVSRDEIGSLVTAFNSMLAQLGRERENQQELASRERAARAQMEIVESVPIAMVVTSIPRHEVLHANEPAAPWLDGITTDPWGRKLEPGVRARFFQQLADRGAVDEFEVRWNAGGESTWAVLSARRLQFQGRDAVLTAFTPVNVLKQMEQRLELWSKVFEASSEGIAIMDDQQRVLSINHAFCRSTGLEPYEVVGKDFTGLVEEIPGTALRQRIGSAVNDRGAWQGEVQFRRRAGASYPAWLMVSAVRSGGTHGSVSHYIGISVDITERKRTEERVRFLADHDVLTELPNRSLCVARLAEALENARDSEDRVAVLFIDLDRFKSVNDTLGHHVGDALLRSVAGRLTQAVRNDDTVSRLGGDEFVVILRDVRDAGEIRDIIEERLIPLIRAPHDGEGHELRVSCSIGVAVYPEDGQDIDELMRRADAAMYEAKSSGRDHYRFFSSELDKLARERRTLEQLLRHALERGELEMHYQPRVDARTLQVVGAEALMRWTHPEVGSISPARFIPIAEETGLIRPLGLWAMQQACDLLRRWKAQRRSLISLSVNISATQLADPALLEYLRDFTTHSGIDPQLLELEVTETQLMENAGAAGQGLAALRQLGVRFSIDDFGTGYSSLAYLKRFPIDKLKIDRSFVQDLLGDTTDLAIVRAIMALGHNLGLGVVAEGVENFAVAHQLKLLGCDELQGYHFARPMRVEALEAWIDARQARPETQRDTVHQER